MPKRANDPIGCVPASWAVQQALEEARRRVEALEYLLEIARGMESRLKGERVDDTFPPQNAALCES